VLSIFIMAGQRGGFPQFEVVLDRVRVPRLGPGRPRTGRGGVRAEKAYASRAIRAYLRRRGIRCTIPDKADQARNRKKRGFRGGRPPKFDPEDYKARHAVESGIITSKGLGRGHEERQTRVPLRGNGFRRRYQRVDVTSYITMPTA
jgi:hypothetical protein